MTPLSRYALPGAERCAGTISAGQSWYGWRDKAESTRPNRGASTPTAGKPGSTCAPPATKGGHGIMPGSSIPRPKLQVTVPAPRATSVYRYYDAFDVLLYVGVTSRAMRRNDEHNTKEWWQFVTRQEVEHYSTREEALRREKSLILDFMPPFNRQHNPDYVHARAAYLAFVQVQPDIKTTAELLTALKRRIPLTFRGDWDESGRILLYSNPIHWRFTSLIQEGKSTAQSPAYLGESGPRVGSVVEVNRVGQTVAVAVHARKNMRPFKTAQAVLKALQNDARKYRIGSVHIDAELQPESHKQRRRGPAYEGRDITLTAQLMGIIDTAAAKEAAIKSVGDDR